MKSLDEIMKNVDKLREETDKLMAETDKLPCDLRDKTYDDPAKRLAEGFYALDLTPEQTRVVLRGQRAKIVTFDEGLKPEPVVMNTGGVIPNKTFEKYMHQLDNYEIPAWYDKEKYAKTLAGIEKVLEDAAVKPCEPTAPFLRDIKAVYQPRYLGADYEHVNHPLHYQGKYEVIDILRDKLSKEEYIGFLKGSILKYQLRLGKKENDLDDARKAMWYLAKLVQVFDHDKQNGK